MRRDLAALTLTLLLAAGPALGAWDHPAGDAARTGVLDAGPEWPDVAFEVHLPGTPTSNPVFAGDAVWIATRGDSVPGLDQVGVWRIDLRTGIATRTAERAASDFATLVGDLVLSGPLEGATLAGADLVDGTTRWTLDGPPFAQGVDVDYARASLVDGTLLIGYGADPDGAATQGAGSAGVATAGTSGTAGLLAVDATSGEVLWDAPSEPARRANLTGTTLGNPAVAANDDLVVFYTLVRRAAPAVPTVPSVPAPPARVTGGETTYRLIAFDRDTGAFRWERSDPVPPSLAAAGPTNATVLPTIGQFQGGGPLLTPTFVFVRTDRFLAINPGTGAVIWESEAGLTDPNPIRGTLQAGWNDGVLVATTGQTVYRLDPATGAPVWQVTETTPDFAYSVAGFAVSPTTVYAAYLETNDSRVRGVEALDVATGARRWRWESQDTEGPPNTITFFTGYGRGLAVAGRYDGTVTVLGRTPASLQPPVLDTTAYPEVGDEVSVDLSRTGPGAFGPATRFRADWGDGNATAWQTSPVFTHAYDALGPREARFYAANDANQTASVPVTYRVGEPEPNVLSEAFAAENQERTFFVLGLVITGIGALVGLLALRRKRGRLRREMEAVDRVWVENKTNAGACDLALRERRARARGLVLDGTLDDAQGATLERHIDDLSRRARLSELDEGLDFLPMGIARRLREALEDGRVSTLEHDVLVRLVAEDTVLTLEQKTRVRLLVDAWWRRDNARDKGVA